MEAIKTEDEEPEPAISVKKVEPIGTKMKKIEKKIEAKKAEEEAEKNIEEAVEKVNKAKPRFPMLKHEEEKSHECSICYKIMVEPILLKCGHRFCSHCLIKYMQT